MSSSEWLQPMPARAVRQMRAAIPQQTSTGRLRTAVSAAAQSLAALQHADGFWCGDLTADCTLEADYVLLQLWLHQPTGAAWEPPTRTRIDKACRVILERQLTDGGWNIYEDGPSDINASVKAYSALRIAGVNPHQPAMLRARQRILALGGLQCCNSYVRINLSLFGLYPRKFVPSVPTEVVLLPLDILYEMSSWTRTILVPLSIVQAAGGERRAPAGVDLEELFHPQKKFTMPSRAGMAVLFHHFDRVVKLWERRGIKNVRSAALREAEHWILDRTRYTEGLGAIYPAMMYHIMALHALGYAEDHPDLVEALRHFDNLLIETETRFCIQPCVSPVWDTAYAAFALGEMGQADPAALTRTADWLLTKEVRRKGDWSVKRPDLEPSGWAFEFANEYYPDIDDTAMVLLALQHAKATDPVKQARCERRAINWLLGMQSSDGGWAAFDVDNNWQILNKVPFADHNAMLDPTCPDVTGRVLEALCRSGLTNDHPAIRAGLRYLLGCQEENGSWYGRWGVNYLYGTFLAARGLRATRDASVRPVLQKAAQWIRNVQNADGGWGESCASYRDNRFVPERSTASQTAWALLGLYATGDTSSTAVQRGTEFLLETQRPDGKWDEHLMTGTGFPNVFFLRYHMYCHYFPLLALAEQSRVVPV